MFFGEFVQDFMDGKDLLVRSRGGQILPLQIHSFEVAAVALSQFAPGPVNEDAAHGLGGSRKEMSAICKRWVLPADQPQPRLVDKFRRLQCLAWCFTGHLARGQPAQFVVNESEQLFRCLGVALFDGI
jgi:hypothetical protein